MNKYNAKRTEVDGIWFASKGEARRYRELKALEQGGYISDLQLQPMFLLQEKFTDQMGNNHHAIKYRADFQYTENGENVVEEFKGRETPEFRIKMKLFLFRFKNVLFRITR